MIRSKITLDQQWRLKVWGQTKQIMKYLKPDTKIIIINKSLLKMFCCLLLSIKILDNRVTTRLFIRGSIQSRLKMI